MEEDEAKVAALSQSLWLWIIYILCSDVRTQSQNRAQ